MTDQLTEGQLKAAEKIQKMLNLAAKAGTPEEAATATAMAQKMLLEYNLDAGTVEGVVGGAGKREQQAVDGGFYEWQRALWRAVAELNFCMYWSQKYRTPETTRQNVYERDWSTGEQVYKGKKYVQVMRRRHALIGRAVNVAATKAMAAYLEQAIKRVARDSLHGSEENMRSNWAKSFQHGASDEIISRLRERRGEILDAERAAQKKATKGHSDGRALAVASLTKSEADANYDHRHGEGSAAERDAHRAENARVSAAMEASYTAWAAANPGKAAKEFAYYDKDTKTTYTYSRNYSSGRSYENKNMDYSAYSSGSKAAKSIGLDQQAEARGAGQRRIG